MSTLEDLDDLERHEKEEKKDEDKKDGGKDGKKADGDADMQDAEPEEEQLDEEILNSSTRDIVARRRLLENDMRIMKSEYQRLTHEKASMNEKIKDNLEKIENNRYDITVAAVGPAARQLTAISRITY
jgi:26S proteasome regulatory subunit T5